MKPLTHLKSTALALIIGGLLIGQASAAWLQPTLQTVGFRYYRYANYTWNVQSTATFGIPAAAAQAIGAPYGANVAGYAYNSGMYYSQYFPAAYLAQSQNSYYAYLGALYAYQNYQNPAYAQQLQTYYENYATSIDGYYTAIADYTGNYWEANADYYANLIVPQ
jgi:hypothetical protein